MRTGVSPYDMARLASEFPDVFEAWARQHERPGKHGSGFQERRAAGRKERMRRIFGG
jgi:hypothetical protein